MLRLAMTRIGLGTAPLGNLFAEVDDIDAEQTIDTAWRGGVRYFDTAPHYGLGLAEQRLGMAIRKLRIARDDIVISTKVGRLIDPADGSPAADSEGYVVGAAYQRRWDFTPAGVRRSLDDSCVRLDLTQVDIALLHDPDEHMDQAVQQGFPTLAALRTAGRIAAVGAGMNSAPNLARIVAECDVDVVMLAGRYSLLDQSALDDLLPLAAQRGVAVVVAGVFNSGLLAQHEPPADGTFDYQPAPAAMIERVRRLAQECEAFDVSVPQAALQFAFGHPAVAAIVIGARTSTEIRTDLELAAQPVPPACWQRLRDVGLLRADAPLPGGTPS